MGDDIYRYFAADVFHDGRMAVSSVDLHGLSVTIQLENMFACNKLSSLFGIDDAHSSLCNAVNTTVEFRGVRRFRFEASATSGPLLYHLSELDRQNGDYILSIFASSGGQIDAFVDLTFSSAVIQDISEALQCRFPGRPLKDIKQLLSFIDQQPEAYVDQGSGFT